MSADPGGGTVLVTGVGGLIGRAVARALLGRGRAVVGMDVAMPDGFAASFLAHDLPAPQRWHEAITRFGVTRAVHAGGVSGPMLMRDDPGRLCAINLAGLAGLLEAARVHRLERVVWFSSVAAYGSGAVDAEVGEDTPLLPDTVYGATKAAGEALVHGYHREHGVDAVALRVVACYGPGRTTACLVRTLVEDALACRATAVRDEPGWTRQHVFIGDVVEAACVALDRPHLPQRAYNIAPGRVQSAEEIAAAVPGARLVIRPDGMGWNRFPLGALRIEAARRDLGFEPATTLAEGAARTRAWVEAGCPT